MAHECPDRGQACYCDGDDTWMDSGAATCGHGCDPEEDDSDGFDDEAPYAAPPAARADEGAQPWCGCGDVVKFSARDLASLRARVEELAEEWEAQREEFADADEDDCCAAVIGSFVRELRLLLPGGDVEGNRKLPANSGGDDANPNSKETP